MKTTLLCASRLSHFTRYSRTRFPLTKSTNRPIRSISHFKMPAPSEQLTERLKLLSVTAIPEYTNCFPDSNPVDIYRAHLTSILTEVTGVDAKIVYPALQWTQTPDKGDLILAVPALRIKGKKLDELANEWIQKVGSNKLHGRAQSPTNFAIVSRVAPCPPSYAQWHIYAVLLQSR